MPQQQNQNPFAAFSPDEQEHIRQQLVELQSSGKLNPAQQQGVNRALRFLGAPQPRRAAMVRVGQPLTPPEAGAQPEGEPSLWEQANTPLVDLFLGAGTTQKFMVGDVQQMQDAAAVERLGKISRGEEPSMADGLKEYALGAGERASNVVSSLTSPLSILLFGIGGAASAGRGALAARGAQLANAGRTAQAATTSQAALAGKNAQLAAEATQALKDARQAYETTKVLYNVARGTQGAAGAGLTVQGAMAAKPPVERAIETGDPAHLVNEEFLGALGTMFGGAAMGAGAMKPSPLVDVNTVFGLKSEVAPPAHSPAKSLSLQERMTSSADALEPRIGQTVYVNGDIRFTGFDPSKSVERAIYLGEASEAGFPGRYLLQRIDADGNPAGKVAVIRHEFGLTPTEKPQPHPVGLGPGDKAQPKSVADTKAAEIRAAFSPENLRHAWSDGFIDSVWNRIQQRKPLLFSDRPGTLESKLQAAIDEGRILTREDVAAFVKGNSQAPSTSPSGRVLEVIREKVIQEIGTDDGLNAFFSEQGLRKTLGLKKDVPIERLEQQGIVRRLEDGQFVLTDAVKMAERVVPEVGSLEPAPLKQMPPKANALADLKTYTDRVWAEADADTALSFLDENAKLPRELRLSNDPSLVSRGKGILLEFDSAGLRGRVNETIPQWEGRWNQGEAEFVAKATGPEQWMNNLRSLTIRKEAVSGGRLQRLGFSLKSLEQKGWERVKNPDGSITIRRPDAATPLKASTPPVPPTPPKELLNDGIRVNDPQRDLGLIARYLGSPSQQFAKISPLAGEAVQIGITATEKIGRNTVKNLAVVRQVANEVRGAEMTKLIELLDDPKVSPETLPATVSLKVAEGYVKLRFMLDDLRSRMVEARREAGINTPDDFGIQQGYFPHVFEGDWAVTVKKNGQYVPVETGWRQVTREAALEKAREYKAKNPTAELLVELDEVDLSVNAADTPLKTLRSLAEDIRKASRLQGQALEDALSDIESRAEAGAFGRKISQRRFGHAERRESNLAGWMKDPKALEILVRGAERYIEIVKARPKLIDLRNKLAAERGESPITGLKDIPRQTRSQIVGALDAYIERLEGKPTPLDAAVRRYFKRKGWNPYTVDKASGAILEAQALLKLGYSPVSALVNLSQTALNTFPVLGAKYTSQAIRGYVSGKYKFLLEELGVHEQASKVEESSFTEYRKAYQPHSLREVPKATKEVVMDVGLFLFRRAEEANRAVAAIGFYQRALAQGKSVPEAIAEARKGIARTQFVYNTSDTAPIFSPQSIRVIRQFRSFALKEMEFILGLKGAEIPRFATALLATVGVVGIPGVELLDTLFEGTTSRLLGKKISLLDEAKVNFPRLSRGVGGALGVDLTPNIGFSDLFGPRMLEPQQLFGPTVSDLTNLAKMAMANEGRDFERAKSDFLRRLSPAARRASDVFFSDLSKGQLRDPKTGALILNDISPKEQAMILMGLTPMRVAAERDLHNYAMQHVILPYRSQRGFYIDRLAELQVQMETASPTSLPELERKYDRLLAEAEEKGVGEGIDREAVQRARELMMERRERDQRKAPRPLREHPSFFGKE